MAGRKEFELLFKLQATLGSGFNSSFNSAMNASRQLQGNLSKINTLSGKIEGFQKQSAALQANKDKLAQLTEEHDRLQREMSQTERPSEALRQKMERNARQIEQTTARIEEQEARLGELGNELRDAGVDTDNLTEENERLAASYERVKKNQEKLASIAQAQQKNNEAISKTKTQLAGTLGTFAAVGAAIYAGPVKKAAEFEAQMSSVQSISNATGEDMAKLATLAKKMGATTQFTAVEAGQALEYMAMAGWKTDQMMGGLPGIMNLAAASGENLGAVSDIVTDALTAFGMTAEDSGRFADVLAQASSNANTNVAMMGSTFQKVAPVAGALGYSVEDMSLGIGLMANASIKAETAGTSLKTALANMAKPTAQMQTYMDKYGISLTNADGGMKSFREVVDNLRGSLGGLAEQEQIAAATAIFGKESFAGMLAIVNASEADYNKLAESINNSAGAAERMATIKLDNLEGDITLMKSAIDGLQIAIGEALLPAFRASTQGLTGIITKVTTFINENPKLVRQVAQVAAALAGLKVGALAGKLGFLEIKGGVLAVQGAFTKLKAFAGAGGGIKSLFSGLGGIGGKLLPIVGIIGGVALAIKLISGNLEEVRGWIQKTFGDGALAVFDKVWGVIQNVGAAIKGVFSGENMGNARNFFQEHFGDAGVAVFDSIIGVVEQLKAILPGLLDQFGQLATSLLPVIGSLIQQIVPLIGEIIATVLPVLFDLIAQLLPVIGQIVEAILPVLIQLVETLVPIIMQIIEAVLPILQQLLEALMPIIQQIIDGILPVAIDLIMMVVSAVMPLVEMILPLLQQLLEALMPIIQMVAELFGNQLATAVTMISGIIDGLTQILSGLITFITGVFTGNWKQAWEGVKSIFSGIWESIKSICTGVVNGIINVINTVIGGLNRLKIPDWVPGIGGKGINIPLIPALAKGSRFTPDTFIAGEAGAELITNARGRTVFTAAQTGRIFDNINAAREAQDGTTVVTLLPLLQAALSAARVGAGGVSAPSVTAAEPRGAGIVIHSAPVFHVGSDAQAEDIEAILNERDERLLNEFDDRMKQQEEDERRRNYD